MDYARNKVFDSLGKEGEKWVGFDLDGTLAEYNGWKGKEHIGKPIKDIVLVAKQYHDQGKKVKIFTARVADETDRDEAAKYIKKWCKENLGFVPEITFQKDALMDTCFDDRCMQVFPNTGTPVMEAFNDALDIIKDLTDGFRNCQSHLPQIERLIALAKKNQNN